MLRQCLSMASSNLSGPCHSYHFRHISRLAKCLKYFKYGEPADVLKIYEEKLQSPKDDEVLVKILAAPINPVDINTIQGKYPVKPKLPAIGGNEFVGEVIHVGKNVKTLQLGDRVIPSKTGIGAWNSKGVYAAKDLMKIVNDVGIPEAATITVNPCTAYRMLKDYVPLQPGDTVIQNGANSSVGQAVHQLCKAWGIASVGVVRTRQDIDKLKTYLKSLGATEVLTEQELPKTDIFLDKLKKPKLGLNCVGGNSASGIAKWLDYEGILVTYGGMSRQPVLVGTGSLIFKHISFVGFWMTKWALANQNSTEKAKMYADLFNLLENGKLTASVHEMVPLEKYKEATTAVLNTKGFTGKKYILDFQNC